MEPRPAPFTPSNEGSWALPGEAPWGGVEGGLQIRSYGQNPSGRSSGWACFLLLHLDVGSAPSAQEGSRRVPHLIRSLIHSFTIMRMLPRPGVTGHQSGQAFSIGNNLAFHS